METLTLGEIKSRMLKESNTKGNGASLYHDEFGHIIAPILLTQWPQLHGDKPIVFSDEHLAMEQLTELCHCMLLRCQFKSLISLKELPVYKQQILTDEQLNAVEQRLFVRMKQPNLYLPDPRGTKLNKWEALSRTRIFTLESAHIIAERYAETYPELIRDPILWEEYKEETGFLLYCLLCGDYNVMSKVECQLNDCFHLLDLSWIQMDIIHQTHYMNYLNKEVLEAFYDDFIEYFNRLDRYFKNNYSLPLSKMTPSMLDKLSIDMFPKWEPPCKLQDKDDNRSNWRIKIEYDSLREVHCITHITPPDHVMKKIMSEER